MKVGIYFVLYLAVIIELLIVIVDRDEAEDQLKRNLESVRQANMELIKYIANPPTVGIESQVTRVYVDADDQTGAVRTDRSIDLSLKVKGLDGDTRYLKNVALGPILFDKTLSVLTDQQVRELDEKGKLAPTRLSTLPQVSLVAAHTDAVDPTIVDVPLRWNVKGSTAGIYKFTFQLNVDRIRFIPPGKDTPDSVQFGKLTLPYDLVVRSTAYKSPAEIKEKLENPVAQLYVAVIDSSRPAGIANPPVLKADSLVIAAGGNEAQNEIRVENVGSEDIREMHVRQGFGEIKGISGANGKVYRWVWVGTPSGATRSAVVVEATDRLNRPASCKFTVDAVVPKLKQPLPNQLCEREPLTVNVHVDGLDRTNLYSLKLFVNDKEVTELATSGVSSATYDFKEAPSLKNLRAGTQVRVEGYYNGHLFKYYNEETKALMPSIFTWTMNPKPILITGFLQWPRKTSLRSELKFRVYRACNVDYREPVEARPTVKIIDSQSGNDVTSVFLLDVRKAGDYDYSIVLNPDAGLVNPETGDKVKITIGVPGVVSPPREITFVY